MTGREAELQELKEILEKCRSADKTAVSITGIGGIGKTATLLEIAHQEADRRNIFFVHAHDAASLHQAYYHIAKTIGPEYLLKEYRGQDIQQIWSNESPEDKVGRFKVWLKDPENEDSLFLLDDMDGIQLLEHREAAFPDEAKTILYTTRNPVYHKDNIRSRHKVRLSAMDEEDTIKLMEAIRDHESGEYDKRADLFDRRTLVEIMKEVYGHPLAASNAIKYIIRSVAVLRESDAGRRFIDMLRSNEFTRRLRFLEYCPDAPSIMENFNVSQDRLPKPNGPALAVINFLAFLETDIQDEEVHFQKFFFDHSCPLPPKDFPDREILESDEDKLLGIFSDLEKVSFGERLQAAEQGLKRFNFHPLWLECTRHSMGDKGRIRYARQVLFICYHTIIVDHGNINILSDCNDSFLPHVRRCLQVCKRFKLGLDNLKLPPKVSKVFRDIEGGV